WRGHLALGLALTAGCLAFVGVLPDLAAPTALPGGPLHRGAYAAGYALSIWYWTFGLLGAAVRFASREHATRRYLADASYWIYLAHLPLIFGLQVLLMELPLHWAVKFPLIVAAALAVLLVLYRWAVRPTALGELLNGRRIARPRRAVAAHAAEPTVRAMPGAPSPED